MGYKKYTEEQIITILKEVEAGVRTADICRKHNVSDATIYKWKAKYAGMEISDVKKMKSLEAENSRLKEIVAEQSLDIRALKDTLSKKF